MEVKIRGFRERSAVTIDLVNVLLELKVGQVMTYEAIQKKAGWDVRNGHNSNLRTARSIIQNEQGNVIDCVPKVGVKFLTDEEVIQAAKDREKRIGKMTRKELRRLATVDYDALPPTLQTEHNARMLQVSIIGIFAQETSYKRIEAQVQKTDKRLAAGTVLEQWTN